MNGPHRRCHRRSREATARPAVGHPGPAHRPRQSLGFGLAHEVLHPVARELSGEGLDVSVHGCLLPICEARYRRELPKKVTGHTEGP
jgi:hypothetical protein